MPRFAAAALADLVQWAAKCGWAPPQTLIILIESTKQFQFTIDEKQLTITPSIKILNQKNLFVAWINKDNLKQISTFQPAVCH